MKGRLDYVDGEWVYESDFFRARKKGLEREEVENWEFEFKSGATKKEILKEARRFLKASRPVKG